MSGIQGSWPGGPRRDGIRKDPGREWQLESMADRAERVARGQRASRRSRRERAIYSTLGVAALFAALAGFVMGRSASRTSEEIAQAEEARAVSAEGLEAILQSEGKKVIRNMWLSEILEQNR